MDKLASDHPLTTDQQQTLKVLARLMIPASVEYQVPGADDDLIFADILGAVIPHHKVTRLVVEQLDDLAGSKFGTLSEPEAEQVAQRFRMSGSTLVGFVHALVAMCYYRDDRVMRSLDMEPRAPYPEGFEVDEGDWSLLDPVRARSPMYRLPPEE